MTTAGWLNSRAHALLSHGLLTSITVPGMAFPSVEQASYANREQHLPQDSCASAPVDTCQAACYLGMQSPVLGKTTGCFPPQQVAQHPWLSAASAAAWHSPVMPFLLCSPAGFSEGLNSWGLSGASQ